MIRIYPFPSHCTITPDFPTVPRPSVLQTMDNLVKIVAMSEDRGVSGVSRGMFVMGRYVCHGDFLGRSLIIGKTHD